MIKIIIPVDEDSLDGFSAILRMSLEPKNRKDLDAAVARIKEDGSATISPEILKKRSI